MSAEQLALFPDLEPAGSHPSLSAPVPAGWTPEIYQGFQEQNFKRAIDQDGLRWYWIDEKWILNVPYFRNGKRDGTTGFFDLAICDSSAGGTPYPIDDNGTIHIGTRRVQEGCWHH